MALTLEVEPLKHRYQTTATIYLIRHGEKPPKDENGDDDIGLSQKGKKRAQGICNVFGLNSPYKIGYILAQEFKPSGARKRPYDTVLPLAEELDLKIYHDIDRDDARSVARAALSWEGEGNVLICWEHHMLSEIVEELGVEGRLIYPKHRFDIIWAVKSPHENLHSWTSEGIKGLDEEFAHIWG